MPELQRLRADHGQAVLAFELANRAYFAVSISDRGDDFYGQFTARHRALLGATATVREVCRLAAAQYGLLALTAATSSENVASRKVLTKAGFVPVGPADPTDIGGKQGTLYRWDLPA